VPKAFEHRKEPLHLGACGEEENEVVEALTNFLTREFLVEEKSVELKRNVMTYMKG
jgi:hypothetical protein